MTEYTVTFFDQTDDDSKRENGLPTVITFGIYQNYPETPGLLSVAWQRGSTVSGGQVGIKWKIVYNAILSNYFDSGETGVYQSSQVRNANFKDKFEVRDDQSGTGPVSYFVVFFLMSTFIVTS